MKGLVRYSVAPLVSAASAIFVVAAGCENDDRDIAIVLMFADKVHYPQAMHVGHIKVQDHQIHPPQARRSIASSPFPVLETRCPSVTVSEAITIRRKVAESSTTRTCFIASCSQSGWFEPNVEGNIPTLEAKQYEPVSQKDLSFPVLMLPDLRADGTIYHRLAKFTNASNPVHLSHFHYWAFSRWRVRNNQQSRQRV